MTFCSSTLTLPLFSLVHLHIFQFLMHYLPSICFVVYMFKFADWHCASSFRIIFDLVVVHLTADILVMHLHV